MAHFALLYFLDEYCFHTQRYKMIAKILTCLRGNTFKFNSLTRVKSFTYMNREFARLVIYLSTVKVSDIFIYSLQPDIHVFEFMFHA